MRILKRVPCDAHILAEGGNAACGQAALAAAIGKDVLQVLRPFMEQGQGVWVSQTRMIRAIEALGMRAVHKIGVHWPVTPSVSLVQGLGSWMNQGVPFGARNERTHWIATVQDLAGEQWVYDINANDWLTKDEWQALVLPSLLGAWKTDSWNIRAAYQLLNTGKSNDQ